jgi:membrane protein implicated in regulation of membrane protease activity
MLAAFPPRLCGWVRVGDFDWPARGEEALVPGSTVRVVAVEGVTLVVSSADFSYCGGWR